MNQTNHTSRTTIDHDVIRRWAEDRGAQPTTVKGTGEDGGAGIIRLDFPGWPADHTLEAITWDEFFEVFDRSRLAFHYQEAAIGSDRSNFNKLMKRPTDDPSRPRKPTRKTGPSRPRKGSPAHRPTRSRQPMAKRKGTRRGRYRA